MVSRGLMVLYWPAMRCWLKSGQFLLWGVIGLEGPGKLKLWMKPFSRAQPGGMDASRVSTPAHEMSCLPQDLSLAEGSPDQHSRLAEALRYATAVLNHLATSRQHQNLGVKPNRDAVSALEGGSNGPAKFGN